MSVVEEEKLEKVPPAEGETVTPVEGEVEKAEQAEQPVEEKVESVTEETPAEEKTEPATEETPAEAPKKAKKAPSKKKAEAKEEAPAEEEAAEAPKKKPSKKAAAKKKEAAAEEAPAEPEVEVIEAVDSRTEIKVSYAVKPLFGKYSFSGVVVPNPGLQRYINIEPVSIPHTGARHANRPFAKQHMNIVERLINGMMRTEHGTGQKAKMYRVVEEAFDIIERRTKENPIQVYIDALCNSAPKEEVTRLRYGGINVPKAVDVSASRRLDIALRNICRGAVQSSHKSRKRLPQSLADELVLASKRDINSFAVGKKEEVERIAASAR